MAQDFESNGAKVTDSATTIYTSDSNDAIVGLRLANLLTTAIIMDVYIYEGGSTNRYLCKNLSIPPASSVELIQGGAKVIIQNLDVVKGLCGTENGCDAWISVVDAISS